MAKIKKLGSKENPISSEELEMVLEKTRPYVIQKVIMKDGKLEYKYEVTAGNGKFDVHTVKGNGMFLEDLPESMARLRVHLAVIDDAFKNAGVEIDDIDTLHGDELTCQYHVDGIEIKGSDGNESIIIFGSKFVASAGGRIDVVSPKIPLDNLSSYKWYNELKSAADQIREETALYKEGKIQLEEEEVANNPRQMTIGDALPSDKSDDDFESGKL